MSITINSAVYGSNRKGIDVTQICQEIVNTGNDDITASNANFTDPDPGPGKNLVINFTNTAKNNGMPITLACPEHGTLDLVTSGPMIMPARPSTAPTVSIVRAFFGSNSEGWDVTDICQWMVGNGATTIAANIYNFGDPDPGNLKIFSVIYTAAGSELQYILTCQENNTLNLTTS